MLLRMLESMGVLPQSLPNPQVRLPAEVPARRRPEACLCSQQVGRQCWTYACTLPLVQHGLPGG